MKCSDPQCRQEVDPGKKICLQCRTPVQPEPEQSGEVNSVRTGEIGYLNGHTTDANQHVSSNVGSVVVQTEEKFILVNNSRTSIL